MLTNNKVMAVALALALCGLLALAGRAWVATSRPFPPGVWTGMKVGAYAVGMLGGRH